MKAGYETLNQEELKAMRMNKRDAYVARIGKQEKTRLAEAARQEAEMKKNQLLQEDQNKNSAATQSTPEGAEDMALEPWTKPDGQIIYLPREATTYLDSVISATAKEVKEIRKTAIEYMEVKEMLHRQMNEVAISTRINSNPAPGKTGILSSTGNCNANTKRVQLNDIYDIHEYFQPSMESTVHSADNSKIGTQPDQEDYAHNLMHEERQERPTQRTVDDRRPRNTYTSADLGKTVKSWNVKFNGSSGIDVEKFLRRVKECMDSARLSETEVLGSMSELLTGTALRWLHLGHLPSVFGKREGEQVGEVAIAPLAQTSNQKAEPTKFIVGQEDSLSECSSFQGENLDHRSPLPPHPRWWTVAEIGEFKIRALLDSGASRTCFGPVGLQVATHMGIEVVPCAGTSISGADGQLIRLTAQAKIRIKVANKTRELVVFMANSLDYDCVLGADWRVLFYTMVDPRTHELYFNKVKVCDVEFNCNNSTSTAGLTAIGLEGPTPNEEKELEEILARCLPINDESSLIGCTDLIEHEIEVTCQRPIKQRCYPVSKKLEDIMYEQLDDMIRQGIVKPSKSSWASPVVMVKKANGKYRFCVDDRKLNAVTKVSARPIPNMDSILRKLRTARYITTLDLSQAYHQVRIKEEHRHLTAFAVPGRGLYEWVRMAFGLAGAPATFQSLMDSIIGPDLEPYAFAYLDDIIIATSTFEQHKEVLADVLTRLTQAGLTINREKSHFCRQEVKYLGVLVDRDGYRPDPEKIEPIVKFPTPKTLKQFPAKLAPKFYGPLIITAKVGTNIYELADRQGIPVGPTHVKDLKRFHGNSDEFDHDDCEIVSDDEDEEVEIQENREEMPQEASSQEHQEEEEQTARPQESQNEKKEEEASCLEDRRKAAKASKVKCTIAEKAEKANRPRKTRALVVRQKEPNKATGRKPSTKAGKDSRIRQAQTGENANVSSEQSDTVEDSEIDHSMYQGGEASNRRVTRAAARKKAAAERGIVASEDVAVAQQ
ncbi:unnamed protein product [Trichogramma brassicae]|uniref:Reverse transcriptase domain-containing protein n=1 Tax=Trichogramma brassicae TaxID=86971 RepID=A0A6H5IBC6_9HYME|nr:unnamed protein product [Trichogramma brassicae]